jgi:hypothetical protein
VYVKNVFVESGMAPLRVNEQLMGEERGGIGNIYDAWLRKSKAIGFAQAHSPGCVQ